MAVQERRPVGKKRLGLHLSPEMHRKLTIEAYEAGDTVSRYTERRLWELFGEPAKAKARQRTHQTA